MTLAILARLTTIIVESLVDIKEFRYPIWPKRPGCISLRLREFKIAWVASHHSNDREGYDYVLACHDCLFPGLYPTGHQSLKKVDLKSRGLNEPELHDSTALAPAAAIPQLEMDCDDLVAIPHPQVQTSPGFHIHLLVLGVREVLFLECGLPAEGVFYVKDQN